MHDLMSTLSLLNEYCTEFNTDHSKCSVVTRKMQVHLAELTRETASMAEDIIKTAREKITKALSGENFEFHHISTMGALSAAEKNEGFDNSLAKRYMPLMREHEKKLLQAGILNGGRELHIERFGSALAAGSNSTLLKQYGGEEEETSLHIYRTEQNEMHRKLLFQPEWTKERDQLFRMEDAFHSALLALTEHPDCPQTARTLSRLHLMEYVHPDRRASKGKAFAVENHDMRITTADIDATITKGWDALKERRTSQFCVDLQAAD